VDRGQTAADDDDDDGMTSLPKNREGEWTKVERSRTALCQRKNSKVSVKYFCVGKRIYKKNSFVHVFILRN